MASQAHINYSDLDKLNSGIVDDMGYNCIKSFQNRNCEVCCEGKQTRLSFPKEGSRTSKDLELVHADVCGPMESKSIGGS